MTDDERNSADSDSDDETGSVIPFPNIDVADEEFALPESPFSPPEDVSSEDALGGGGSEGTEDGDEDEDDESQETVASIEVLNTDDGADEAADGGAEEAPDADDDASGTPDLEDDEDLDREVGEQSAFDAFTSDDYVRATTSEYEGLAKEVEQAAGQDHAPVAHAVGMPGVETGVVGFEDVTGESEPVVVESQSSDLTLRVVTALIVMGLFLGSLWLGRGWLAMLVGIVGLVAVTEFYFSAQRVGFRPMVLLGILGTAAVLIAAWWGEASALLALAGTTGAALLGIVLWYALMPRALPLENAGLTFLGVIWVGTTLAFVMPIARAPDWRILIGFVVVVNAGFDIGSYFVGRSLGKTALAPQLSPRKTIEGLAGGIALAAVVGVLMAVSFEELVPLDALILVVVISLFALIGDLSASFVKRALGLKDMGTVLPGHGGVIDRIDGLLMAVPAVFFALDLLGYL